jgi:multiple sugar transport system permease protein
MGGRAVTRIERRNLRNGVLFTLPWTIGLIVFTMFPAAMSLGLSLSDYSLLNEPVFVGLTNYKDMAVDNVFQTALWNTGVYAAMALPFGMVLAIALALLLNQRILARPVFRTIFFLPSLVPLVALAILWNWILQGNTGALNHLLGLVGIKGPNWLGDPAWSKPALMVTGLWGVGNAVVIYLAGLQDVPRDFYEAARVDGASWWQQTWHITLPMISPVIYFNLLMGCIGVLQIFAVPYVMTSGGPMRSTLFYTMYLYQQAFRFLNMGYACAMAWVLFVMVALLTYTAHRVSRRHVYYGGA